MVYLSGTNTVI